MEPSEALLGVWSLIRSEDPELNIPGAAQVFKPGGSLQYLIPTPEGFRGAQLTWRVEGEEIITDQPSSPRVERTRFAFEGLHTLRLEQGGVRSWYRRETPTIEELQTNSPTASGARAG